MRTFIVSSGWQHNYDMAMIPKLNSIMEETTYCFHCPRYAPGRDVGAKTNRLPVLGCP